MSSVKSWFRFSQEKKSEKDAYLRRYRHFMRCLLVVFSYAESKSDVVKLKMAFSLSNLHISKMAAELKKYQ